MRIKEKNLRCKFGKTETSKVGRVNQEGNQEDIAAVLYHWQVSLRLSTTSTALNLGYVVSRA